jgi:hypothetical protein
MPCQFVQVWCVVSLPFLLNGGEREREKEREREREREKEGERKRERERERKRERERERERERGLLKNVGQSFSFSFALTVKSDILFYFLEFHAGDDRTVFQPSAVGAAALIEARSDKVFYHLNLN